MKSRQLANVLIKMLGLSVCLYAIPSCVASVILTLSAAEVPKTDIVAIQLFKSTIVAGVETVFGIMIIAASRKIAGWMFRSDDE